MIKAVKIGEIKVANNGNKYKIICRDDERSNSKHTYYKIRFIESGYESSIRSDDISSGYIKDNLCKSVCGVASVGYINSRSHIREYKIWSNIIHRCYDPKDKSYKYYGGKGVTVYDRWLRFDHFFEDFRKIPGFDEALFREGKIKLDKDIKSKGDKIYSLETTMWVSDLENQKQKAIEHNTKYKKYAIFPDGHKEMILHVTDFCKKHNLHRTNVEACLEGKQKTSKGFKFYREQS